MRRLRTFLFGFARKMEVWEFTGRTLERRDSHPPFTEDCPRGSLMQWWFEDAVGARRCLATGLMLPSVSIMDRDHGPLQLDAIDREHRECSQQTGGFMMDERLRAVSPLNPFNPLGLEWRESSPRPEGPRIWQHCYVGVKQQVSLAPQALRVPERGRMKLESEHVPHRKRCHGQFGSNERLKGLSFVSTNTC